MAAKTLHAFDYLARPEKHPPLPLSVVFGDEPFLRRQSLLAIRRAVLGDEQGGISLSTFPGRTAVLADVLAEVATVAMFGPAQRLVVVDEADDFVSRYRAELEDFAAHPVGNGVLALDLKTLPANTRLFKAVSADGLAIDCKCPPADRVAKWLTTWAERNHQAQLSQAAAKLLVDSVGAELGLLDQELAKLVLSAGPAGKITPEMIRGLAGGWRTRTTWEMLDAALGGNPREALTQLDRLLASGENPVALHGQISASLRRLAAATRFVKQAEAAGRRPSLRNALEQAGVQAFVLAKTERELRHLGRPRASRLYRWLLEADLDMKGASALPPRLTLERLIIRLAAPLDSTAGMV